MQIFRYAPQIALLLVIIGILSYRIVYQENQLMEHQILIPQIVKKIQKIEEKKKRLQYEIDSFENPIHLMELLRQENFAHLHHPYTKDILGINEEGLVIVDLNEGGEERK